MEKHTQRRYFRLDRRSASDYRGFSLVELLIALFIFALLSGFAYRAVNAMTRSQTLTSEEFIELSNLQRAFVMLERDAREALQIVQDEKGGSVQLTNDFPTENSSLSLVVGRKSSIVRYSVDGNVLYRTVESNALNTGNILERASLVENIESLSHKLINAQPHENAIPSGVIVEVRSQHLGVARRVIGFGVSRLKSDEIVALNDILEPVVLAPTTIGGAVETVSNEPVVLDNADIAADDW